MTGVGIASAIFLLGVVVMVAIHRSADRPDNRRGRGFFHE